MGFITTITANNDFLHDLVEVKAFGRTLYEACLKVSMGEPVHVPVAGITVVETHHADYSYPILIGGRKEAQIITEVSIMYSFIDPELELLKQLAHKRGYDLHKKPDYRRRSG